MTVYNYRAVNNLRFWTLHGMEEVVGSIPTRSTKLNQLFSVALGIYIPIPFSAPDSAQQV
jgi:hypothetical protein